MSGDETSSFMPRCAPQGDYTKGHDESLPYTDSSMRSIYHIRDFEVYRLMQVRIAAGGSWGQGSWAVRQGSKFRSWRSSIFDVGLLQWWSIDLILWYPVQPARTHSYAVLCARCLACRYSNPLTFS